MNKKELNELSKIELEKLGREKGVELDRRYSKKTLVNQIYDLFSKKTKKELERATDSVEIKTNNVHVSASEDIKAKMRNLNF